jgi:hypothetical protein
LVVNKPEKHHVGRPRKVVIAMLSPLEIKKEDGSNKRGDDCHLQRMIWEAVKEERILHKLVLASFVASHYCCNKKNGNNLEHYTF